MGRASDAPAAASAGTRVGPKTPASSPPSAGRSQNAGPLRAGSHLQSEPHIEPERKAPRPSSPGPCHLPTKAICCRIFTPALPDDPAASVRDLLSGDFNLAEYATASLAPAVSVTRKICPEARLH